MVRLFLYCSSNSNSLLAASRNTLVLGYRGYYAPDPLSTSAAGRLDILAKHPRSETADPTVGYQCWLRRLSDIIIAFRGLTFFESVLELHESRAPKDREHDPIKRICKPRTGGG